MYHRARGPGAVQWRVHTQRKGTVPCDGHSAPAAHNNTGEWSVLINRPQWRVSAGLPGERTFTEYAVGPWSDEALYAPQSYGLSHGANRLGTDVGNMYTTSIAAADALGSRDSWNRCPLNATVQRVKLLRDKLLVG